MARALKRRSPCDLGAASGSDRKLRRRLGMQRATDRQRPLQHQAAFARGIDAANTLAARRKTASGQTRRKPACRCRIKTSSCVALSANGDRCQQPRQHHWRRQRATDQAAPPASRLGVAVAMSAIKTAEQRAKPAARLWEAETGKSIAPLPSNAVVTVALSADGRPHDRQR